MAKAVRCRVTLDELGRRGKSRDQQKNVRSLLGLFRKRVNESGILTTYKENQYYESRGEKRRRKKKEMEHSAKKDRLRLNFG